MEELLNNKQNIELIWASASHQNGTAESVIKNSGQYKMYHIDVICAEISQG